METEKCRVGKKWTIYTRLTFRTSFRMTSLSPSYFARLGINVEEEELIN